MIKCTKLDKYERQREKEQLYDMTETLDEQWKALSILMGIKERKSKDTKDTSDDYDKLVNALRFETKTIVGYSIIYFRNKSFFLSYFRVHQLKLLTKERKKKLNDCKHYK